MITPYHIVLFICWTAYCVLHSVMAAGWFKKIMHKLFGIHYKYYRLLYSVVAAITLALLLTYHFNHNSILLYRPSFITYVIAIPGLLAGVIVMAICIKKYFVNLSGVDVFLKQQREPVLETGGLHAHVRHPLYSGTLLFVWALFLLFPQLNNLIACTVITAYTLLGIKWEEEKLILEFGQAYKDYASSIPMLIPSTLWPLSRKGTK